MEKRLKIALWGSLITLLMACNPIRSMVSPENPSALQEATSTAPATESTDRIANETNTPQITSLDGSNLQDQTGTAAVPNEIFPINTVIPAFDNYPTGVPGAVVVTLSSETEELIALATDLLARKFNATADEINLLSIVSVEWPDGGLGCRRPGARYPDVITPGYQISLEWERAIYIFHSDMVSQILLCHVQPPHEIYSKP
jgi:hypothetical protein